MIDPELVRLYASQGLSQSEVARGFGCSRQRIHQIALEHEIAFTKAAVHDHSTSTWPAYRAGCEECKATRRLWQQARRHNDESVEDA